MEKKTIMEFMVALVIWLLAVFYIWLSATITEGGAL